MEAPKRLECDQCENNAELEARFETLSFRGVRHDVIYYYYKCYHCDNSFTNECTETYTLKQVPAYAKMMHL